MCVCIIVDIDHARALNSSYISLPSLFLFSLPLPELFLLFGMITLAFDGAPFILDYMFPSFFYDVCSLLYIGWVGVLVPFTDAQCRGFRTVRSPIDIK